MRGRPISVAIAAVTLALAAGCTSGGGGTGEFTAPSARPASPSALPSGTASPSAAPQPARSIAPASAAGGMCEKLDYAAVETAVGVRFGVAAATGTPGREQVCALAAVGTPAPDLTLAMAPTDIDAESFKLDYQPKDGKPVAGIGLAAYSQVTAGGQGGGPIAEIGWLDKKAIYTLTFSTLAGTAPDTASAALPGLIQLAKAVG